ncbi:hypothetical protein EST38_g6918 [Candolleomyces aberdarensis]|uniref:Ricin B lectin domain-containing protein n=1 Tax=Candolleomyces aberdarensis TaxID=2316362 RepID=A0A4Q2DGN8_9AGAR|nr:hypothetical protein EST38_g6918 [Candolleomyces aberdarensis]
MPYKSFTSLFSSLLFLLPSAVLANRHFDIINNCPLSLNLLINGNFEGTLASGGSTTRDFPDVWSGVIYSDFNRGNVDTAGTVRAGFQGTNSYYYIVKDPKWLNVGINIQPIDRAPRGGFCPSLECRVTTGDCENAYTSQPTSFPAPTSAPPASPLAQCPQTGAVPAGYRVTFCPDGTIPNYQTRPNSIQPKRDPTNKCADVQGGVLQNGQPVQIYDCNGTGAQKWVIKRGGQQIMLSGTGYCLDATSASPANGVKMKIWECLPNVPAQQWTYTSQDTIVLTGTNKCLDLTDGSLANGNRIQVWDCAAGNDNQVWII